MITLLPIGLAIALNAAALAFGVTWLWRQTRRVSTERATEYRGLFQLEPQPPAGDESYVLVEDDDGRTSEIEAVHWPYLGWTDAVTLLRVEGACWAGACRCFPRRRRSTSCELAR